MDLIHREMIGGVNIFDCADKMIHDGIINQVVFGIFINTSDGPIEIIFFANGMISSSWYPYNKRSQSYMINLGLFPLVKEDIAVYNINESRNKYPELDDWMNIKIKVNKYDIII